MDFITKIVFSTILLKSWINWKTYFWILNKKREFNSNGELVSYKIMLQVYKRNILSIW
jgi:hypothetical protein